MQESINGEIHMKEISYETVQILVNFSYGQVKKHLTSLISRLNNTLRTLKLTIRMPKKYWKLPIATSTTS